MSGHLEASPKQRARTRDIVLAMAIAFVCVLPFLDKAVHQDDWAYLTSSRLLLEHGADVLTQETHYQGVPITVGQGVLHGPVWMLVLLFSQSALFGEHWLAVAHLFAAGTLAILAGAAAGLAGRLGARPLPTSLALVTAPASLVLASGLMTDLPMVALFTWSIALAWRGLEDDRIGALIGAGVVGALAGLTRYHGMAIVPLLLVMPLFVGALPRGHRWRALLPPFVAGASALGVLAFVLSVTQRWDILRATDELAKVDIDYQQCVLASLAALGGTAFGWLLTYLACLPRALRGLFSDGMLAVLAVLGLGAGLYASWLALSAGPPVPTGVNLVLQWTFIASGGLAVGLGLRPFLSLDWVLRFRDWRQRLGSNAFLGLWCGGFLIAAWFTVPFGSTRYAMPCMPPLFLLAGVGAARTLPPFAPWIAAILSATLGLLAAEADTRAAAVYPELAADIAERVETDWAGSKTWIWGEIDFRWYLEREAGLEVLPTASNAPAPGDRILKTMMSTATEKGGLGGNYKLNPAVVRRMEVEGQREYGGRDSAGGRWPVRVHTNYAPAGFYGASGGFLPYAFSTVAHDVLQIWRITDENPFLAVVDQVPVEIASYPASAAGGREVRGSIKAERFIADAAIEQKLAVSILFPGRITFPEVPVPAEGAVLELFVAEHERLSLESIPGPGSYARVFVNGQLASETKLDTRRGQPRAWHPVRIDLGRVAGRLVEVTFESAPIEGPGMPPAGEPLKTMVGFAEPRLVPGG